MATQDADNGQSDARQEANDTVDVQRIPKAYQGHYKKALAGKSRKAAIRAFCLECVGWNAKEVRLCTAKGCPLYQFRLKG